MNKWTVKPIYGNYESNFVHIEIQLNGKTVAIALPPIAQDVAKKIVDACNQREKGTNHK